MKSIWVCEYCRRPNSVTVCSNCNGRDLPSSVVNKATNETGHPVRCAMEHARKNLDPARADTRVPAYGNDYFVVPAGGQLVPIGLWTEFMASGIQLEWVVAIIRRPKAGGVA